MAVGTATRRGAGVVASVLRIVGMLIVLVLASGRPGYAALEARLANAWPPSTVGIVRGIAVATAQAAAVSVTVPHESAVVRNQRILAGRGPLVDDMNATSIIAGSTYRRPNATASESACRTALRRTRSRAPVLS